MKTNWICKECEKVQQPVKKEGHWEHFNPRCDCGGRLTIKLGKLSLEEAVSDE